MARDSDIPPESFDEILDWLNPDRDVAGSIYVQLRENLTKLFTWHHCPDPEGATDEVIDRVAKKIHVLKDSYVGKPQSYFFGVAHNLIKEIQKKIKMQVSLQDTEPASDPRSELQQETARMREDCLHSCLQKLSKDERELILTYYAKKGQAKIEHRIEIARRLGISMETLRVKAYRIRMKLEKCIERCLDRMTQNK